MTHRPIIGRGFLLIAFVVAICSSVTAQQRPLITEDVDIIPPGTLRIEAGIDFFYGAKVSVSGLTGDETRVGVICVTIRFSPHVEFYIEGVAQKILSINTRRPSPISFSFDS